MRVIAAVVNFNCASSLIQVVKALLDDDFDTIYVLDDASTDDSLDFLREFLEQITVVAGETNLGPAGNRNRILPYLKGDEIVLFIDADMDLKQYTLAKTLKKVFAEHPNMGAVGGLILTKNGNPMRFNYGVLAGRFGSKFGIVTEGVARILPKALARRMKPFARKFTYNLDIVYGEPFEREVGWVAEGLSAFNGHLFKELSGFDNSLRYHEGQELAYRIHKAKRKILFTPKLKIRHLEAKVRENRAIDSMRARRKFYKKLT